MQKHDNCLTWDQKGCIFLILIIISVLFLYGYICYQRGYQKSESNNIDELIANNQKGIEKDREELIIMEYSYPLISTINKIQ